MGLGSLRGQGDHASVQFLRILPVTQIAPCGGGFSGGQEEDCNYRDGRHSGPPRAGPVHPGAGQEPRNDQQRSERGQVHEAVGRDHVGEPDHAECREDRHKEEQPADQRRPGPTPGDQQCRDQ